MKDPIEQLKKDSSSFSPDPELYAMIKEKIIMTNRETTVSSPIESKSEEIPKQTLPPGRKKFLAAVAAIGIVGSFGTVAILNSQKQPSTLTPASSPTKQETQPVSQTAEPVSASSLKSLFSAEHVAISPLMTQSESIGGHEFNNISGGEVAFATSYNENYASVRFIFDSNETDWWVKQIAIVETSSPNSSDHDFNLTNELNIEGPFFKTPLGSSYNGDFKEDGITITGMDLTFTPYQDQDNGEILIDTPGTFNLPVGETSELEYTLKDKDGNLLENPEGYLIDSIASGEGDISFCQPENVDPSKDILYLCADTAEETQIAIVVARVTDKEPTPQDVQAVKVITVTAE